jgi:hypothetical protein
MVLAHVRSGSAQVDAVSQRARTAPTFPANGDAHCSPVHENRGRRRTLSKASDRTGLESHGRPAPLLAGKTRRCQCHSHCLALSLRETQ